MVFDESLTVIVSSSENSFLNFPGIFCKDKNPIRTEQILDEATRSGSILTSQVWVSRPTAAAFRPIITAKKQLRFLCALQLKGSMEDNVVTLLGKKADPLY